MTSTSLHEQVSVALSHAFEAANAGNTEAHYQCAVAIKVLQFGLKFEDAEALQALAMYACSIAPQYGDQPHAFLHRGPDAKLLIALVAVEDIFAAEPHDALLAACRRVCAWLRNAFACHQTEAIAALYDKILTRAANNASQMAH